MGSLLKLELISGSTSLDISDIQNFIWQGHAGFGLPALHRITLRGPQQHGETDMGYLLDPRTIMLAIRLMGSDIEDLYNKQAQLLSMCSPSTALSLRFTRIGSAIVRQIDVVAVGGLDFASAQRAGYTLVEQITLRAADPTWYDPTPAALGFAMGGSAPTVGTGGSSAAAASFTPTVGSTVYYVDATNGNDNYNGLSTAAPFKTLAHATSVLTAGATLYLRGRTYNERLVVTANGASGNYINVMSYPGETAVIDGTGNPGAIGLYDPLVNAFGNYIYFGNLEIRNSVGMGVYLNGINNVVHGCYVHHIQSNGVLGGGDGSIIEFNQIWRSCLMNEFGKSSTWPSACSTARETGDLITDNGFIRSNIVWENWGEGISSYQSTNTIIEDNIVHDSFSANLYVSDSTGVIVRRNHVWADFTNTYMYTGLVHQGSYVGIMDGSELQSPALANITIVNNIVYGCNRNYYWWINAGGDHMIGYTIANNIFANGPNYSVQIAQAAHTTSVFQNNIVIQDDAAQQIVSLSTNITYSNNIWSKNLPSGTGAGTGDYTGNPGLNRQGSPYTSPWSSDYYKPLSNSPAINAGTTVTASALDFYRVTRSGTTDIGPVEYVTSSLPNALTVPMIVPFSVGASSIVTSQSAAYPGTADSFPWITVTGPITSALITLSDGFVTYTINFSGITIAAGDVRVIDLRWPYKTIQDASGANRTADITDDSVLALFALKARQPGETTHANSFSVSGSNTNSATRIDVNWFNRFIGN